MRSVGALVCISAVGGSQAFTIAPLRGLPRSNLQMVAGSQKGGFIKNLVDLGRVALSPSNPTEAEILAKERERYYTHPDLYAGHPLSTTTHEDLIGEELVTDDASASALADRCIAEALRLFHSDGWDFVFEQDEIRVETKESSGAYAKSGVRIVRGMGTLDSSAEKFFDFQVSREGFQCIDEYLENHRNVDRYKWTTAEERYGYAKDDYELMMNRVEWRYPAKTREFVALDIVDRKRKILISKSALHKDRPGGSRYQAAIPKDETEFVRAVQYYASIVEDLPNGKCLLRMVTWGEMCDDYSAWWVNKFNAHLFITPKFDRFRRAMAGETVFELNDIFQQAWKLPALVMRPPDKGAANSDFVKRVGAPSQQKS